MTRALTATPQKLPRDWLLISSIGWPTQATTIIGNKSPSKTISLRSRVPILHVGAWYDIFLGGTLRNYLGIKARGGSEEARRGQRLMVVTGGHSGPGPRIGEVDFGRDSVVNDDDLTLRWYDYLLKGVKNGLESEKPVKLFVLGKNVWREEDDWPLARARNTRFYLHSQGKANSLSGDGTLSTSEPSSEHADQYVYDPADPVPTRGGPLCCDAEHLAPGAVDQRPVEARSDVLVYSTPPFKEDFEVTGPVSVELYASSSAVDTDFTAQVGGRLAEWLCAESHGGNLAGPLPQFA